MKQHVLTRLNSSRSVKSLICLASLLSLSLPAQADLKSNLSQIPEQSVAVVNIDIQPQTWQFFLNKPGVAQWFQNNGSDFKKSFQEQTGLGFDELSPYLGTDLSLAMINSTQTAQFVSIIDLSNPRGLAGLLAQKYQSNPQLFKIEKSQGHLIFSNTKASANPPTGFVISGQSLIIGAHNDLKTVLNSGSHSILNQNDFQHSYRDFQQAKIWAYFKPAAISPGLKQITKSKDKQGEQLLAEQMALYQSIGIGLNPSSKGLILKTVATLKTQGLSSSQKTLQQNLLKVWQSPTQGLQPFLRISPAKSLFFMGAEGLDSLPLSLATGQNNAQSLKALQRSFQDLTNLNLEQDLLKHLDGRIGLAVSKPSSGTQKLPEFVLILGVKNKQALLNTMTAKLQLNLDPSKKKGTGSKLRFSPKPSAQYQGFPIYSLENNAGQKSLQATGLLPSFTMTDQLWILGSSPQALKEGLDSFQGKSPPLESQAYFSRMKQALGLESKNSLIYIDLQAGLQALAQSDPKDRKLQQLGSALQGLKSFMAGSYYRSGRIESIMMLDLDFERVDFQALEKILK